MDDYFRILKKLHAINMVAARVAKMSVTIQATEPKYEANAETCRQGMSRVLNGTSAALHLVMDGLVQDLCNHDTDEMDSESLMACIEAVAFCGRGDE